MELNINLKLKKEDYNIITYFLNLLDEEQLNHLFEKEGSNNYTQCDGKIVINKVDIGYVITKIADEITNKEYSIDLKISDQELELIKMGYTLTKN